MFANFFNKFQRVTASTHYLPEIDGLRFLAVFWVAILMHTTHYLDTMFYKDQLVAPGYWKWLILEGTHGMYLFFMISGFILSLPFAKAILGDAPHVDLKRYYIRRLTRLEPPYIIALILFFIAHVFVLNKYPLEQLVPSFFASLIYSHGILLGQHPYIMPVAWSLEIEVQFYLLAPLLCGLFYIRPVWLRRLVFILILIAGTLIYSFVTRKATLFRFGHYFFAGILLADLYVSAKEKTADDWKGFLIGMVALVILLVFPSRYVFPTLVFKLILLFIVFYQVLFNERFKALFSVKWMAIVGGMCYSIYLLHFGIISCLGAILLSWPIVFSFNQAPLYLLLFTLVILMISAAYFYYIEKPFMQFHIKRLKQPSKE